MWRYSGDWMVIWDDRILEILFTEGTGTATDISKKEAITVGRSHITKRLSKLADKGLCKNLGNGVYALEHEGVGYLLGIFDVQNEEWIRLSDERAVFHPSDKPDDRWQFEPDYADSYRMFLRDLEIKVSDESYTEINAKGPPTELHDRSVNETSKEDSKDEFDSSEERSAESDDDMTVTDT